jgi:hypothetical protein
MLRERSKMPATADGHRRSPSSWARFLVASSPSEDLRIHAKHLFVAANQQSLGHTRSMATQLAAQSLGAAFMTAITSSGYAAA